MGKSEQSVWVDDAAANTAAPSRQSVLTDGRIALDAGVNNEQPVRAAGASGMANGEQPVRAAGTNSTTENVPNGGQSARTAGISGTAAPAEDGRSAHAVNVNNAAAGANGGASSQASGTNTVYTIVQGALPPHDTEETRRLKENFGFIAPAAFIYAVFYVFCMFKNGSGITYPFFVGGSLLFLLFSSSKLGITLKKGSGFYGAAMILLGISTFCTDDARIIFFNKWGIFLLMMSLLLRQFCDTSKWKLGKYIVSIFVLVFASLGELGRPFSDGKSYWKGKTNKPDIRIWYFALGLLIGIPLLLVVLVLLASADAVFRQMTKKLLYAINLTNIFSVLFRIIIVFFAAYALTAYLCKRKIKEGVEDKRNGEPILAITISSLLTLLYLWFSGIQIAGLFLRSLQLPAGYTYAMYAREGFFQLLAVSFINLVIVLMFMSYFKESKVLKAVLTVMSLCTFVMIASSAMRMVIYIRYYYLTFLRILVLWGLALLAGIFVGVVINIFRESFPLFRYSVAVVAVLYLALSFAHPDYIIARVNVANAFHGREDAGTAADGYQKEDNGFFLAGEPYQDYAYLRNLCADAAPVLVPYLKELGYHMEAFYAEDAVSYAKSISDESGMGGRSSQAAFGYHWMAGLQRRTENFGIRTYNLSRHLALRSIDKAVKDGN